MSDNRKISIAIPTFNRYEMTIKSFEKVLDDDRVSEVVISDDASTDFSYTKFISKFVGNPKVRIFSNPTNQDCYVNKGIAIQRSTNDWSILFDSDNTLGTDYIDRLYEIPEWDEKTIYAPCAAEPHFDYRKFSGAEITKENVSTYMSLPNFSTCMNTANFFVNRSQFLKVWDGSVVPHTSDSIFFNYCWLKANNKIKIVSGLRYLHLVHEQSHYKLNQHKTGTFYTDIEKLLKQMR